MKRSSETSKDIAKKMLEKLVGPELAVQALDPGREASVRAAAAAAREEMVPLIRDLARSGWKVESLDDLRRSGLQYDSAIPVILKWLPRLRLPTNKESAVRTLSVPWAGEETLATFVSLFRELLPEESLLKWAVGNGIEVLACDRFFADLASLVTDRSHGRAREMVVLALGKIKSDSAERLLIEMLDDDDVCGHAVIALGKLRSRAAEGKIRTLLNHPRAWIRREARKAIDRIQYGR